MTLAVKKFLAFVCFAGFMLGFAAFAYAEGQEPIAFSLALDKEGNVELYSELLDDEHWLFLPAFAQLDALSTEKGELEWWDSEPDEENVWYVDVVEEDTVHEVKVMRSENLRTVFLFSDDPENQGIAYVEDQSTKHENETSATVVVVDSQGKVCHREHIEKLRGRGNGSWGEAKRSYQMKLDVKADLLDTGLAENKAKKWLLMADTVDKSMLQNRISMDLAREIGLTAMESEHVDLYYDGLYRGLYRLSEKVEVGEGRLDILDYENLLEKWNRKVGQYDLDQLPVESAYNRFGMMYTYKSGVVDNQLPSTGGYLIEMEDRTWTLSDPCYFELDIPDETQVYALKNPENASRQSVEYVSELLQEGLYALKAGGVYPETGVTAEERFDMEAFARALLIQELSGNLDGYQYSSSYFVLPEGETRFQPGPLWDFDLSYRLHTDGSTGYGYGFKDQFGWLLDFYQVPAFAKAADKVWKNEIYPLIQDVLLGENEGVYLWPLEKYIQHIAASKRMNEIRWKPVQDSRLYYPYTAAGERWQLRTWIERRSQWILEVFDYLAAAKEKHIQVWVTSPFVNSAETLQFVTVPWENYHVEVTGAEQLTEATEEEYARWRITAAVSCEDRSLEGYTFQLNGTPLTALPQEDGTLLICFDYDDESYRPVDYYGQDVGLIYQFDRYVDYYPEIGEAFDYDEESVMNYFFDEGVYEGQVGNGFFEPREIVWRYPYVHDYLGDEWSLYYWEYLDWGRDSDWVPETYHCFLPAVSDAAENIQ